MPSLRISKKLNNGTYFITFVVYKHQNVLDKYNCCEILADSLNYRIKKKEIIVEGFVFMRNHIHLIVTSQDMIRFVRNFKRFTAKVIKKNLPEGLINRLINTEGQYQFWERTNMPIWIETDYFFQIKLNYIHENPTRAGYVEYEDDWCWSSANNFCKIYVNRSNW